jgi:hypothetical protein
MHFEPETLDRHRDTRQISFRFEQAQHRNMGGYFEDPVLLVVTLFNPALPPPEPSPIGHANIERFYPPVDDEPRRVLHFGAQRWLPELRSGAAVTHAAATNEGRGDNLVSGPPERWLVIHVDPERRVRVDLYAWRKAYALADAQALARRAAESVRATPRLAALFDAAPGADAREEERFEQTVAGALARLRACGNDPLVPGTTWFSDDGRCAAWLSEDRRWLRLARAMGRVPLAAARPRRPDDPGDAPRFAEVRIPPGRAAALVGPPDYTLAMLFWDTARAGWAVEGVAEWLDAGEREPNPLLEAIWLRLRERDAIHLVSLARYDLRFSPDRVAIEAFLSEADRVARALAAGEVIPGVPVEGVTFGR